MPQYEVCIKVRTDGSDNTPIRVLQQRYAIKYGKMPENALLPSHRSLELIYDVDRKSMDSALYAATYRTKKVMKRLDLYIERISIQLVKP